MQPVGTRREPSLHRRPVEPAQTEHLPPENQQPENQSVENYWADETTAYSEAGEPGAPVPRPMPAIKALSQLRNRVIARILKVKRPTAGPKIQRPQVRAQTSTQPSPQTPEPAKKHDPAPSRAAYRLQRLWLTPLFRALVRTGVPAFTLVVLAAWYMSDEARVDQVKLKVTELRTSIEQRPEFMVNLMQITDVSAEVAEDIREVTAIDFPVSSFELDLGLMRTQIQELDAVARAELVISPGGILNVEVIERVPVMVWRGRDDLELLDGQGHRVASLVERGKRGDLPLIVGDGADLFVPQALALFKAGLPIGERLRGLSRVGERRWDVILQDNRKILLPEIDPVAALERVIALDGINDLLARDFSVIDMRNGKRPTVQLAPNATKSLRETTISPHGENSL